MKSIKRYTISGLIIIALALVLSGCGSSCDDPNIEMNAQIWTLNVTESESTCYPPGSYITTIVTTQSGSTFGASGTAPFELNYSGKICGNEITASADGVVYGGVATAEMTLTVTGTTATGTWDVMVTGPAAAAASDGTLRAADVPPGYPCSFSADLTANLSS